MAVYDAKPSVFETNNNGSYTYRWNIRQIQMPSGEGTEERTTTVKWECDEGYRVGYGYSQQDNGSRRNDPLGQRPRKEVSSTITMPQKRRRFR